MRHRSTFSALVASSVLWSASAMGQGSARPDFSGLDPAWAAQEYDEAFQSGPAKAAWLALKTGFPDDYKQFLDRMARAALAHEDTASISGDFIAGHTVGQVSSAARAPARVLVAYQRAKADLIRHLSSSNPAACAVVQDGLLPEISAEADPEGARRLYGVLGAFIDAAAAGRDAPGPPRTLVADDFVALQSVMISSGANEGEAAAALLLPATATASEKCRAAVLLNDALASAPEDLVSKMAIIAPQ